MADTLVTGGGKVLVLLPLSQNEPWVAVHPQRARLIAIGANEFARPPEPAALPAAFSSRNGGRSWVGSRPPLPPGLRFGGDPTLAFNRQGELFYAYVGFNLVREVPRDGSILVSRSRSGGRFWRRPVLVSRGRGGEEHDDKPFLTVDAVAGSPFQGRVYVAWTRFLGGSGVSQILFSRATAGADGFTPPQPLSDASATVTGASIAVGRDGDVYAGWIDYGEGTFRIRRSADGGDSFAPAVTVAPIVLVPSPLPPFRFRTLTFAFLAADTGRGPFAGRVYAVWQDFRGGDAGVWLSFSSDRGESWSPPAPVDDAAGSHEFFPNVAVTAAGNVNVIYYSNAGHPELLDARLARSVDGGLTFPERLVLNAAPIDPLADPLIRGTFFGDYLGIAPLGTEDAVVAAWTDTRRREQDIVAALVAAGRVDRRELRPAAGREPLPGGAPAPGQAPASAEAPAPAGGAAAVDHGPEAG